MDPLPVIHTSSSLLFSGFVIVLCHVDLSYEKPYVNFNSRARLLALEITTEKHEVTYPHVIQNTCRNHCKQSRRKLDGSGGRLTFYHSILTAHV